MLREGVKRLCEPQTQIADPRFRTCRITTGAEEIDVACFRQTKQEEQAARAANGSAMNTAQRISHVVAGVAAGAALVGAGVALKGSAPTPSPAPDSEYHEAPGSERWPAKVGTDSLAAKVNLTPQATTIEALDALPAPKDPQERQPSEMQVYTVQGTLVYAHREADGDYHLAVQGANGGKMICEAPDPQYATGPWHAQIAAVRAALDAKLALGTAAKRFSPGLAITVTGPLLFDRPHGQIGVSPTNAVELHPILQVVF